MKILFVLDDDYVDETLSCWFVYRGHPTSQKRNYTIQAGVWHTTLMRGATYAQALRKVLRTPQ